MSFIPFALASFFFNSISVLIDKFLLTKSIPNPFVYVFYISAFSLIVIFFLPFTKTPDINTFILGSFSTILWTIGAYFLFDALKIGQTSRVIPIIGTLTPAILLILGTISGTVSSNDIFAGVFLILGLLFLVVPYLKGKLIKDEIKFEIIASLFFANSYLVLKMAYDMGEFLSVMVYSRLILIPALIIILLLPNLRKLVLGHTADTSKPRFSFLSKSGVLLFFGQAAGGLSGLLLTFAISLGHPALVNSLQGAQYIFLFIFSLVLGKYFPHVFTEKLTRLSFFGKITGIILVGIGLALIAFSETKI